MGRSLNYFKEYKIEKSVEYGCNIIKYIGGGDIDLTYNSIGNIQGLLNISDIVIPEYDWLRPPLKLDLVNPLKLINSLNKGLELLEKERNPLIEGELFFADYEIENLDKYRDNLIFNFKKLIELSEAEYFLTLNWD